MPNEIFDVIILVGRPASGKSEIIDYLQNASSAERRERFHIGKLDVLDDFPMLWTWFEEDYILSQELGRPRLHTDEDGYFILSDYWNLLIRRLGLDYGKVLRDHPDYHDSHTILVEFSRGSEHGGYSAAFRHLSDLLLDRAGVLYVQVSFRESLRKNRRRFNPSRPDSILEHSLPDEKLERLYRYDDWKKLSTADPDYLDVRGHRVPYAVFKNEDDITTDDSQALAARLEETLAALWRREQALRE